MIMKHVLFILFTTLLFTGCSKDEDKEVELDFKPTTPTEIVGLWGRQDGASIIIISLMMKQMVPTNS